MCTRLSLAPFAVAEVLELDGTRLQLSRRAPCVVGDWLAVAVALPSSERKVLNTNNESMRVGWGGRGAGGSRSFLILT